jgi:hypothetical protein
MARRSASVGERTNRGGCMPTRMATDPDASPRRH